jgi:hypothetical protein
MLKASAASFVTYRKGVKHEKVCHTVILHETLLQLDQDTIRSQVEECVNMFCEEFINQVTAVKKYAQRTHTGALHRIGIQRLYLTCFTDKFSI